MMPRRLAGLGTPLVIVLAVVALLIAADAGIVAVRLASTHAGSSSPGVARTGPGQGPHPCNHGFYVSQAAHSKKGGSYVSGIAKSKLGKQGGCTAPLPAGAPSAPSDSPDGN